MDERVEIAAVGISACFGPDDTPIDAAEEAIAALSAAGYAVAKLSDLSERLRALCDETRSEIVPVNKVLLLLAADALDAEKARGDEAVALLRMAGSLLGRAWEKYHISGTAATALVIDAFLAREEDR